MPVDRLTRIRDNWEEKGNGPRGRDVDFLLNEAGRSRQALSEVYVFLRAGEIGNALHALDAFLLRLPVTESAQPEEETP